MTFGCKVEEKKEKKQKEPKKKKMKRQSDGKEETKTWKRDTEGNKGYLQTPFPSLTEPSKWRHLIESFSFLGILAAHPQTFLFCFFIHYLSFDLMGSLLEPNRSHQYIYISRFLFLFFIAFLFFYIVVCFFILFYFTVLFFTFLFFCSFLFFFIFVFFLHFIFFF